MSFRAGWAPALVVALALGAAASARAEQALWYNGDYNGTIGYTNMINGYEPNARIYDNFTVTSPTGWTVQSVYSNDLLWQWAGTQAHWEIRSGMSAGNGGTLIASGDAPATMTDTGRNLDQTYELYTVTVNGLNVSLAPGQYWLAVTPIGTGTGDAFDALTDGANAVGTPAGNDANSFMYNSYLGLNYVSPSAADPASHDFSMGVQGVVIPAGTGTPTSGNGTGIGTQPSPISIPEPSSLALTGIGALLAAGSRRRRGVCSLILRACCRRAA